MKKLLIIFLSSVILVSCDPDIPGEGINLPEMEFGFKISPDTVYIKVGDTITLSASISNVLSDGTIIMDGKAVIDFGCVRYFETPIIDNYKLSTCVNGIDFQLIKEIGEVYIQSGTGNIRELYAYPHGDSIKCSFYFIPLKQGTYSFLLSHKFYEGSEGKTRTNSFFYIKDNNGEELWKVPGMPALTPDDPSYKRLYYFAVYE